VTLFHYSSPGQVNAIVPYDLNRNTTHQVLVRRAATYSRPVPVIVAPARPATASRSSSRIPANFYQAAAGFNDPAAVLLLQLLPQESSARPTSPITPGKGPRRPDGRRVARLLMRRTR